MTWRAVCRVSARPDLEAREAVVDGVGGALVGAVGARARGPARYCSPRHGMLRRRCPRLELSWIRCTTRSRTADKTRVQNACRGSRTWRAQFGCPYLTRGRRRRAKHDSQAPGSRPGGSVGLGNGDAGTGGGCQACGATLGDDPTRARGGGGGRSSCRAPRTSSEPAGRDGAHRR